MYEDLFQVKSNDLTPTTGRILIASPLIKDYHFQRSVVMLINSEEKRNLGIVLNKELKVQMSLNELVHELDDVPRIPLYKGGPVNRYNLSFIHDIQEIDQSIPLGNGLFLNGSFNLMLKYIKQGNPIEGRVRFYMGLAGWNEGQLLTEIDNDTWIISNPRKDIIMGEDIGNMWKNSLDIMGEPYSTWSKYPLIPSMN